MVEAVKIFHLHLTDPASALKKKRKYLTEIALHEVFLEAVPATVVIVVLLVIAEGCSKISVQMCKISYLIIILICRKSQPRT